MAVIIVEGCIKCKYTDCAEICPVDCFYEGENMLVIDAAECIDCGLCEPTCPVDAIVPDSYPGVERWVELNARYSKVWPQIVRKNAKPHPDAELFKSVKDKYPDHFSENPGVQSLEGGSDSTRPRKPWGLGGARGKGGA